MKASPETSKIQEVGCKTLHTLLEAKDMAEMAKDSVTPEIIETVASAMRHFGKVAEIQRWGCKVLSILTENIDIRSMVAEDEDELQLVTRVLENLNELGSNEQVVTECCVLLGIMARNQPIKDKLQLWGGIQPIVDAMHKHLPNLQIQTGCVRALANLAASEANATVVARGGIEVVTNAMLRFPQETLIQHLGCAALANCAVPPGNDKRIFEAKGFHAVMAALDNYPDHLKVQMQGGNALANLAVHTDAGRSFIVKEKGLEQMIRTMDKYPQEREIQLFGCSLCANLCSDAPKRELILKLGCVERIAAVLKRFPDMEDVQMEGCRAFVNLAFTKEEAVISKIASAGAVELAQAALARFPDSARVQQAASMAMDFLGGKK